MDNALTAESLRDEMARMLRLAAEPLRVGDTAEAQIARAARRVGLIFSRARKYWYRQVNDPSALDYLRALRATQEIEAAAERQQRLSAELAEVRARIARLEGRAA